MFSGGVPDSVEHVVPRWLQRRFDLWNQALVLPNGTTLPYRQVTVPVARAHNAKFGAIESRISQGDLIADELYLWALKIHIGLLYRDARLRVRQSDPTSSTLLDLSVFSSEVLFFRQVYDVWRSGLKTKPFPFGSTIVLKVPELADRFDFFHSLATGVVGICLGKAFLLVFLWDQGDALRTNIVQVFRDHHLQLIRNAKPEEKEATAYMALHAWACESAYYLWRNRRAINYLRTENGLTLGHAVKKERHRPTDEQTYRNVCRGFGLKLEKYNGEVNNLYSQWIADDGEPAAPLAP
jgi:hypothetical protein